MNDKLEYLLALAWEQNLSKAAEQCDVTQPTFSTGIKQLEDTLGVMLVQCTPRFIGFTTEGERCSTGPAASSPMHAPCARTCRRLSRVTPAS